MNMIATLLLDQLLAAADRVGVRLHRVSSDGNLYAWHSPENDVVYIGKSADDRRPSNELAWSLLDPRETIHSGIVALLRANKARIQPLRYIPAEFDGSKWTAIRDREGWQGKAFDTLAAVFEQGWVPTAEDIEKVLIRVAVRYGTPIGNSQFASQWETPIGSPSDTLAVLAVTSDPAFLRTPPEEDFAV
jgi:hypothetical protein